jgi:hypothetical protein
MDEHDGRAAAKHSTLFQRFNPVEPISDLSRVEAISNGARACVFGEARQ